MDDIITLISNISLRITLLKKILPAFTLVELIVVITIIGILSTVWFVSYSNYLTWARDSNRYSQMTKLSDSLQVYATTKSLPLPDDYIEITASWASNVIAYQWYVWTDVLETIDYTNGGRDPKDDSFYTYYLTKDRKSLQLMALMEESGKVAQNNSTQLLTHTTFAADYSSRFPKVYGKKLWVFVSNNSNTFNAPIQEIASIWSAWVLDIKNTQENIRAVFWEGLEISWTGSSLVFLGSLLDKDLSYLDSSLIWYWDFETLENGKLKDFSFQNNYANCYKKTTLNTWSLVDCNITKWGYKTFNWIDEYMELDFAFPYYWNTWFSSFVKWVLYDKSLSNNFDTFFWNYRWTFCWNTWNFWLAVKANSEKISYRDYSVGSGDPFLLDYKTEKLYKIASIFKTWISKKIYINWDDISTINVSTSNPENWLCKFRFWNDYGAMWAESFLRWEINTIRFYNRALTESEVQLLNLFSD